MKKFKIVFYLLLVAVLTSCGDARQFVYEAEGLVVKSIELTKDKEKLIRGKYIYMTEDLTSEVKIYSNTKFEIGDTIKFTAYCN